MANILSTSSIKQILSVFDFSKKDIDKIVKFELALDCDEDETRSVHDGNWWLWLDEIDGYLDEKTFREHYGITTGDFERLAAVADVAYLLRKG